MKIVDLALNNVDDSINLCIGSKPGFEVAREEKRRWLENLLPHGVGGKLAYFDGHLVGMLEYSPIEYAPFPVRGERILHINCIWVLPNYQRMAIGENLMKSFANEARARGKRGLSVMADEGHSSCRPLSSPMKGSEPLRQGGTKNSCGKNLNQAGHPPYCLQRFHQK